MPTSDRFSPAEVDSLRAAILAEVGRTTARRDALKRSFDDIVHSSEGSPPDDEHDPDGATSGFERAQISALLQSAESDLAALHDAEVRLDEGTYGICSVCEQPVAVERLLYLPAARTCVRCAAASRSQIAR